MTSFRTKEISLTKNKLKIARAKLSSSFNGFVEIEKIEVLKEFRNRGFATKLLKRIILKYPKLVLIVEPLDYHTNSADLIRLYTKLGFKFKRHNFGDCIKIAMVLENE